MRKWDFVLFRNHFNQRVDMFVKWFTHSGSKHDVFKRLRYFFLSTTVILFTFLALSGLIPVLILGEQMSGLFLVVHVTIAPFFVVALMLTTIFWAHFQQFDHSDFLYLKNLRDKKEIRKKAKNQQNFWPKIYFWLFLMFSVPAVLSIIFSMFDYFGTAGQIAMLNIHRYTTLVLFILALFYADLKLNSATENVKGKHVK